MLLSVREWISETAARLGVDVEQLGEMRVKECIGKLVGHGVEEQARFRPDLEELERPLLLALERAARQVIVDDQVETTNSIDALDTALEELAALRKATRKVVPPTNVRDFAARFNAERRAR